MKFTYRDPQTGYHYEVMVLNLGDGVLAYDEQGNLYEAYATWLNVNGQEGVDFADRMAAENSGDVGAYRMERIKKLALDRCCIPLDAWPATPSRDTPRHKSTWTAPTKLVIHDVKLGSNRAATQSDLDELTVIRHAYERLVGFVMHDLANTANLRSIVKERGGVSV